MTALHLVGGELGGVGRSFVCRALVDYHRVQNIPLSVFDTCRSYNDVSRYYQGIKGCRAKGFSPDYTLSEIAFDVFDEDIEGSVIVNLQTYGMSQMVRPWIEEDRDDYIDELRIKNAVVWFVSTGSTDSYRFFQESIDYFQDTVRHVLVKNFTKGSRWSNEETSEKFDLLSSENKIPIIDFPRFPNGEALELVLNENVPYIEAQQRPDLSRLSRKQTSIFLRKAFAAFESAKVIQTDFTHQLAVVSSHTVQEDIVA